LAQYEVIWTLRFTKGFIIMPTMKRKLKVGQRVEWYGESGQIVTVPTDPGDEYGVKLDTGRVVFDIDSNLKEQKPCQKS